MDYFLNDFVDKKGQMIKKVKRKTFVIRHQRHHIAVHAVHNSTDHVKAKHHFKQTTNTNQTTNTGDGLDTNANANTHDTDDETAH